MRITIIADQEIELLGDTINIHDLETIHINSYGQITGYSKKCSYLCGSDHCNHPNNTPDIRDNCKPVVCPLIKEKVCF